MDSQQVHRGACFDQFLEKAVHVAVIFEHCLEECFDILVGCMVFVVGSVQLLECLNKVVQLLLPFGEFLSVEKWQLRGGQVLQVVFKGFGKFACRNFRPQQPLTIHWFHSFHNFFLFCQTLMGKAVRLQEIDNEMSEE